MNYVKSLNFFGVEAKEIPTILLTSEPTVTTEGAIGSLALDTETKQVYKCVAIENDKYTWEPIYDKALLDDLSKEVYGVYGAGKNKFNPSTIVNYKLINGKTGSIDDTTSYTTLSDYIIIPEGETDVYVSYLSTSWNQKTIADGALGFYTKDGTFISKESTSSGLVTIPTGAEKLLLQLSSAYKSAIERVMLEFSSTMTTFKAYGEELVSGVDYRIGQSKNSIYDESIKGIIGEALAKGGAQIKLIGDSITQGVGGTGFAEDGDTIATRGSTEWKVNTSGVCWANMLKEYLESKFDVTVKNYGTRGNSSTELVTLIRNGSLIEDTDDIIICMIGTNDKWKSKSVSYAKEKENIEWLIDYVESLGKKLILISPPISTISGDTTYNSTDVAYHNEDIDHNYQRVCAEKRIQYISMYQEMLKWVDTYADFTETTTADILSSIFSDTIHPNDKGYELMYKIIMRNLGIAYKMTGAEWTNQKP